MIHILNRRADTHPNFCEDAYLVMEKENYILMAVFDGCSDGVNSHFASELHAKLVRQAFLVQEVSDDIHDMINRILFRTANDLGLAKMSLMLNELEILSTVVICLINTTEQGCALVKVLGDGFTHTDEDMDVFDSGEKNCPDYMAYHIADYYEDIMKWIKNVPAHLIVGPIETLSIGTDGISSFRGGKRTTEEIQQFLLEDKFLITSEAMLNRKMNILHKEGTILQDDLTIIRYTNDTIQQPEAETADTGHLQGD